MNKKHNLDVFEKIQLKIAHKTLQYNDVMVKVLGGMTKQEAREIIKRLANKKLTLDKNIK